VELLRTKNQATFIVFPLKKTDGSMLSGATGLDSEIGSFTDAGAPESITDCTNEAIEIGSTGLYYLSLTQAECNVDQAIVQVKSSTEGAITQVILINFISGPTSVANAVWNTLLTAISTSGSIGKLIKDYLDAAISSRPTAEEIDAELSDNHGASAWGASAIGTIAYPDPDDQPAPFLDGEGNPIPGVKIEAFSNEGRTALVDVQTTDVNGLFEFHLNAGNYWFRASCAHFSNYEWEVEL